MIIYSENISPRLRFSAGFLIREVLGRELYIVDDPEKARNLPGPLISYSSRPLKGSFHILPSGFMDEIGIRNFEPEIRFLGNIPFLFPVDGSDLDLDIFAALFYMISRYEEYQSFHPDIHGRFPSEASLAARKDFLELPVVNIWIRRMAGAMEKKFTGLKLRLPRYHFMPGIDIDTAWQIKNKTLSRTYGGLLKCFLKLDFNEISKRLKILYGNATDPGDSFEFIQNAHEKDDLRIFLLAGDGGKFNLNNPVDNEDWQSLVKKLSGSFSTGMHPSYYSSEKKQLIPVEKRILEQVTGQTIIRSRQHFLRFTLPQTYNSLVDTGIVEEYSMGFADRPGFRAGTSFPFMFYDLLLEAETSLKIFPFQIMDRTLKDYLKLDPEQSLERIQAILLQVRKYGGNFSTVWHNDSLTDQGEWKGWKRVYEEMLKFAR